jgi:hypothetical protein
MRRLLWITALAALACVALFVTVADAHIYGPTPYSGHTEPPHCDAVTHLSYYDPRNNGVTVYNSDKTPGDDVYYVDTNPLAGFDRNPDLAYQSTQTSDQDCEGTPVLRATAYVDVTVVDKDFGTGAHHVDFPACQPSNGRNPYCAAPAQNTGVQGAFYVATPDRSHQVGESAGVTNPLTDP